MSALRAVKVEEDVELKVMIDEFAVLHNHLAESKKRYELMKKQLAEAANSVPSTEQKILSGFEFSVTFSDSPENNVVPKDVTNEMLLEHYGLGAFVPSITKISIIDERGEKVSLLTKVWGGRRLLNAFRH
jgi:hypothetical protein